MKWTLLYAKIIDPAVVRTQTGDQGLLDFCGQAARFIDFSVRHQIKQDCFEITDLLQCRTILPSSNLSGLIIF